MAHMLSLPYSHHSSFIRHPAFSYRQAGAMKSNRIRSLVAIVAVCAPFAGWASIISGRRADVAFDSCPFNAHVVVHDNNGREVASLHTPGVVSLKRNRRFFLPARYMAVIEAPGYEPTQVTIRSTLNPWILGNVVIGGIPGLIVVNATGAAWTPSHSEIHRQLAPLGRGAEQGLM